MKRVSFVAVTDSNLESVSSQGDDPMIRPWRRLAVAVILAAVREWKPGADNGFVKDFLASEDYLLWSSMAGLNVDGPTVLKALERNGGISNVMVTKLFKEDLL